MRKLLKRLVCFAIIFTFGNIIFPLPTYSAAHQSKVVFVLFDVSDSTKKPDIRKRYLEDFKVVLGKINPGDIIVADSIAEASITKSTFPIKEEFEKLSFFEGGPLKEKN